MAPALHCAVTLEVKDLNSASQKAENEKANGILFLQSITDV